MTVKLLNSIPSRRRDQLFAEIRRMITEVDAVDRSLEGVGEEGMAIDETLEEICMLLRQEARRAKNARKVAA